MDPQACLADAQQHLRGGEYTECGERLSEYFEWRFKGGFSNTTDDNLARTLVRKLGGAAETLQETLEHNRNANMHR